MKTIESDKEKIRKIKEILRNKRLDYLSKCISIEEIIDGPIKLGIRSCDIMVRESCCKDCNTCSSYH